jgi:multidrug resistance efflux pump
MATEAATSREHIASVARKAAALRRLKAELDLHKANVKTAQAEFDLAVRDMEEYATGQLKFELG